MGFFRAGTLRSHYQRGLKCALIAKALRAAKQLDQPRLGRSAIIGSKVAQSLAF